MAPFNGFWTLSMAIVSIFTFSLYAASAADSVDQDGNIAVKWDIMSWTGDGYTAVVSIYNYQQFRAVGSYKLGWQWSKKEVIYYMVGARAVEQGDCTEYPSPPPHSCVRKPTIIDLPPDVPLSQQVANCCRNGYLGSLAQDPVNAVSAFQVVVGYSGNTNVTVKVPKKLTLESPSPEYSCGDLEKVAPTKFPSPDKKRVTQAYVTWNATCTYSPST